MCGQSKGLADEWSEGVNAVAANSAKSRPRSKGATRIPPLGAFGLLWLALCITLFGFPARVLAQAVQSAAPPVNGTAAGGQQTGAATPGSICGTVLYQNQTQVPVEGARVKLTRDDQSPSQEVLTGDQGQFFFADVAPGPFHILVSGEGFETQTSSGVLHSGETYFVPQIELALATVVTEIRVRPPEEVAEAQVKQEEKQRVLGVIPNFYVTYAPDPVALSRKQKFELAWRSSVDPVTFAGIIFIAAFQQAGDSYPQWGQGWGAYGERYGAFYANVVTGTFLGDAILPSLFKQDPRYFYKGTGSKRSRLLHALSTPFICPGDNGHIQPNYSYVIGSMAAGGISTLYYPTNNRSAAGLAVENGLVRMAESSISGVAQEFIIRKLTPRRHSDADPP